MRVSQHYELDHSQPSLDFVDGYVVNDVQVFLDPSAIQLLRSQWADECRELLATFFSSVLEALSNNDRERVRALMSRLGEPNETHLGFSSGRSRGRGLGKTSGQFVADALSRSRAARTGLLSQLEDTILLVPGIGHDIVSDIATNVLRGPLIAYTQAQAAYHEIPLLQVASGPVWNPARSEWETGFTHLPAPNGRKLLLVPKSLVRIKLDFSKDEYYGDYLIPILQEQEIHTPGGSLVQMLKKGPRVTKKSIKEKYGTDKDSIAELTAMHREALDGYRRQKRDATSPPLDHGVIAAVTHSGPVDFAALLDAVISIPSGSANATSYHRAIEALLTALFYPALSDPDVESGLHDGRKRVDIRYTNVAQRGFFDWLRRHRVPCAHVYVECKNYSSDAANPELDQLAGRFSPPRGTVGILASRSFRDKELFIQRCRDTALDGRGYCIPLDDDDLRALVAERQHGEEANRAQMIEFGLLKAIYDRLV